MITFVNGDLLQSKAEAWVNTVNCVGVMGKGIALQFKERFPDMFSAYKERCDNSQVQTGRMDIHGPLSGTPQWIINFPTKVNWKNKSQIGWIDEGLYDLSWCIHEMDIKSIAIPALGCANGGLNWKEVKFLIEKRLGKINCDIEVYNPV